MLVVYSLHPCEGREQSTKMEISMKQDGEGRRLPCFPLHQAAGAIDVPIQSFTLYVNGIKEPPVTVEQLFPFMFCTTSHAPLPLQMADTLEFSVILQIDEAICHLFGVGRQGCAPYATHYVLYKHMYTYSHSYVSCKNNCMHPHVAVGRKDIHKTH